MGDKFDSINLPFEMVENLTSLGYESMTAIQKETIPLILDKKDIIAQAKTGSGKTAAFGVGAILGLDVKDFKPQVLILCPTRELAEQVTKELRRIARYTHNIKILNLTGGVSKRAQIHSLRHGAHIIVGTPGRIEDHLRTKSLNLQNVKMAILDEADRMLDMGFVDDITEILSYTSKEKQTLLFSATFDNSTKILAQEILKNPIDIKVESSHSKQIIKQLFIETENKLESLEKLLYIYKPSSCIVFCNTKVETDKVADDLWDIGFSAMSLHGDLEQKERNEVLVQFSNSSCLILVATDVAARGLDIDDVKMVVNYDLPREIDVYTHRIGRTGRAGKEGVSISLYGSRSSYKADELKKDNEIEMVESLEVTDKIIQEAPMRTIYIDAGKKHKLRAGDILGALTKKLGIEGKLVGKIDIYKFDSFVAIDSSVVDKACEGLKNNPIKGRNYRAWKL